MHPNRSARPLRKDDGRRKDLSSIKGIGRISGTTLFRSILPITWRHRWRIWWTVDTHLAGAFAITRRLIPAMAGRRHGRILFIASMAALFGMPGWPRTRRRNPPAWV